MWSSQVNSEITHQTSLVRTVLQALAFCRCDKHCEKERVDYILYFQVTGHFQEMAGRNARQPPRSRNHGRTLLTGLLSSSFLIQPRTTSQWWSCPQRAGASHISQQSRHTPPHLATGQSHMANPSMKTPSSPTTLGCVKLSVKTNWDVLL